MRFFQTLGVHSKTLNPKPCVQEGKGGGVQFEESGIPLSVKSLDPKPSRLLA